MKKNGQIEGDPFAGASDLSVCFLKECMVKKAF
jgi:hypothetical protein